jgi:photosystem II stability/assembly factor-like uncharacterized protein
MKTYLYSVAGLLLLVAQTFGQGFYSVHSPNGTDVWAVGNGGTVFRSFDGGITWTTRTLGTATLRSVAARNTNVWIAGENGSFYVSTNSGDNWSPKNVAAGVNLNSLSFVNEMTGWVVGDNGTILKTLDAGDSWSSQTSPTTQRLNRVFFKDTLTGFAVGAGGTFLMTTNGGTSWESISVDGTTKELFSVGASGQGIFVAGADGFSYYSGNNGATWKTLDFKIDSKSDVNGVFVKNPTTAVFTGGGGFIRTTEDGGKSYEWGMHQMHAKLNDVFFYDNLKGWACGEKNNAVLRTTDGGATWSLPQGTSVNYSWSQRISSGNGTGNSFCINPWNKERIYAVTGGTVYISADRGNTWTSTATIPGGTLCSSFYISPKDTNLWIAAVNRNQVRRSTNRGLTWTTTISRNYTTYGPPMEMNPDNPDTVLFADNGSTDPTGDGILWYSTNFGATWDTLSSTRFRSPCDILIVPGKPDIVYLADGVTSLGQAIMWRSGDGGRTWASIYTVSGSEIPMISCSRLKNEVAYATAWGSGGFWKTVNSGGNWTPIASTGSTWGTDVAKDDPNVVVYGVYGGSTSYLSTNAGATFVSSPLTGSNTAILCYDRATILALQTGALWKYVITYTVPVTSTQAVTLTSPNGGESWDPGSVHNITWSTTNIANLKIDYRTSPGDWQTIVASTPTFGGSFAWTIPNTPTTQARVRISDAFDLSPIDSSNADFIINPALSVGEQGVPIAFELRQNYPNPFNPSTQIAYGLPKESYVTLTVYNTLGQEVARLVDGQQPAGRYRVQFSSADVRSGGLSTGMYYYRLKAGDYVEVKKMLLLK